MGLTLAGFPHVEMIPKRSLSGRARIRLRWQWKDFISFVHVGATSHLRSECLRRFVQISGRRQPYFMSELHALAANEAASRDLTHPAISQDGAVSPFLPRDAMHPRY